MQNNSTLILTLVMAAGTILTRFLPFILFPDGKQMPRYVEYLGHVLPYATMGILVVYCLKGVSLFSAPFGIPEFLACALVAVLHAWKRNSLLSIGVGTVFYMILVQMVFVFALRALPSETVFFVSDPGSPRIWLIQFQASVSRSRFQAALAGLVDGSLIASMPVCLRQKRSYIFPDSPPFV